MTGTAVSFSALDWMVVALYFVANTAICVWCALLKEKDTIESVLNPVARFVPGADGAVDLYVAPAYDDVASLYFEGDHWVVHYGERPDPMATEGAVETTPRPYAEQTIRTILDRMTANG